MIDFEATVKLIQKDRSGRHNCHPACSKCVDYAHRYVEAALGDEALFRGATAAEQHTYDHEVDGPYVQVWPEVALPSADDVYGILSDD